MIKKVYEVTKQTIEDIILPLVLWQIGVTVGCIILLYIFIKEIRKKENNK